MKRIALVLAVIFVAAIVAVVALIGVPSLRVATGYAAKQACSCHLVSGRKFDSCLGDFQQGLAAWLTWDASPEGVTVSLAGLFESRAAFDEGFGCHATA